MTDREILIVQLMSGGDLWFTSRARIVSCAPDLVRFDTGYTEEGLTEVGAVLVPLILQCDGGDLLYVTKHSALVQLINMRLWSIDEVVQSVVSAFETVIGPVEVIREGF